MIEEFNEKYTVELSNPNTLDTFDAGMLFCRPEFSQLHASERSEDDLYFQLKENKKNTLIATFSCSRIDECNFKSPKRGSFGGFDVLQDLPFLALEGFLKFVEESIANKGGKGVEIVLPPICYAGSKISVLINVLLRNGYGISNHELNYAMPVSSMNEFRSIVDAKNRNKLNKCEREGFSVRKLATAEELEQVYSVIKINREKKQIPLTMGLSPLLEMYEKIPSSIEFWGCYRQDEMIASSICIRVSKEILYVFYWGEIEGVESFSPVSYLASFIYDYCADCGVELFDAGTASVNGVPNLGLASYKKKLGFAESLKFTMKKIFSDK